MEENKTYKEKKVTELTGGELFDIIVDAMTFISNHITLKVK